MPSHVYMCAIGSMCEGINKSIQKQTWITSCRGPTVEGRRANTLLGTVEASNSVGLVLRTPDVLTPTLRAVWRRNTQVLTTHWDLHATLKAIPLQYTQQWPDVATYWAKDCERRHSNCLPERLTNNVTTTPAHAPNLFLEELSLPGFLTSPLRTPRCVLTCH